MMRSSCQISANFDIILTEMADTGVVDNVQRAKSQRHCVLMCASLSACKSLNYKKDKERCELLTRTLNESKAFLQKQSDSVYMTTDDLSLNVSRVANNVSYSLITYYILRLHLNHIAN